MTTYQAGIITTVPFADYSFRVRGTNQQGIGLWSLFSAAAQFNVAPDEARPTMDHTATGQFTVTNADLATYDYTPELKTGGGTATMSGAVVTLSDENSSCVIHATYKGVPWDAVALRQTGPECTRKKITYNRCEYVQTGWHQHDGPCSPGCTCYGTCGPGSQNCGCSEGYTQCGLEDNVPGGYVKKHGEWSRIA